METIMLIFFQKSSKLNFEINIQVGLNMHLFGDIGDASSSFRGSISSLKKKKSVAIAL